MHLITELQNSENEQRQTNAQLWSEIPNPVSVAERTVRKSEPRRTMLTIQLTFVEHTTATAEFAFLPSVLEYLP